MATGTCSAQAPPTLDDLVRVTGVPLQMLNEPCRDEDLRTISSDLTGWQTVAPYLGLKEGDIEEVETDVKTEGQKRSKCLRKWKNKYGFKATYRVLTEALLECHMADLAEKVCRLLAANPQERNMDSNAVHDENTSSATVYVQSNIPTTAALVTMARLKCTVVQERFEELADGIQIDLLSVARKAFQEKVIPRATLKVVLNEGISEDSRATTLISAILDQIRKNERVYDTFLAILQAEPAMRWLADNLSKHLQKLQKASNSANGTCTSAASITTNHEPGVSGQEDGNFSKKILRQELDSGVDFSNSTCSNDQEVEQEPEFVPPLDDLVRVTGVPLQMLNEPCRDEDLRTISSDLTGWQTVAPYLGLKEGDIEEVETDVKTEGQKRSKCLRKWKNKYGFKATYRVLTEALLECHMADLAEKVCRLLAANPQERNMDSNAVHDENTSSATVYVQSNIPTTAALVTMARLKCTVVQERFEELADGIQIDLLSVARKAFQEKVIPRATLKVVLNEGISEDSRATTLISAILDQIRKNERVYDTFLAILQAEPAMRWLADNLSKHLQKLQKASNSANGTCTSAASITTNHEPGVSGQEDGNFSKKILRQELDSGVDFSNSTCSNDQEVEQEPEFVPPLDDLVRVTGVPLQMLNEPCRDEDLRTISSDLTGWQTVAPYLGLKEGDIEEVETDVKTEGQKRSKCLRKWKNKYGFKATYRVLTEALLECHMADLAEKVCRLLAANPQERNMDSNAVHDENTLSATVQSNIPTTAALVTMAQLKCTVVQERFEELADGIQIGLLSVARKAFQEKVIPHATLKVVLNEGISEDSRATTLISAILDQIRKNERVYDTFLAILQAEPAMRWLADNLSKHLQKLQKASNSANDTSTHHRYDPAHPGVCFLGDPLLQLVDSYGRYISWPDVGISISVPPDAIPKGGVVPIKAWPCLQGPFVLPVGYEVVSPVYQISPAFYFKKGVEVFVSHFAALQSDEDCVAMTFVSARSLPHSEHSYPEYHFKDLKKGRFEKNSTIGRVTLNHFCKFAVARHHVEGSEAKNLYCVQLYQDVYHQFDKAVFAISLCHPVPIVNLSEMLIKLLPGVKFWRTTKQPVTLSEKYVKLTLPDKAIGWDIIPDRTPEISQDEIDLPIHYPDFNNISETYPPRILLMLFQVGQDVKEATCTLEVHGLADLDGTAKKVEFPLLLKRSVVGGLATASSPQLASVALTGRASANEAGGESPESKTIRTNLTKITGILSSAVRPMWFAQKLEEEALMDDATSRVVLGVPDPDNVSVLMNAVKAQIKTAQRPVEPFTKFIRILHSQPTLMDLLQQLREEYGKNGGNADDLRELLLASH